MLSMHDNSTANAHISRLPNVQAPATGAGAQDVLSLEAISGPCEGTVYSKAGDVLSVGRTRASKLHIKDAAVSERHAEVRWETDRWTLTDVGSSNGTAVNGQALIEGTMIPRLCHWAARVQQCHHISSHALTC